MREIPLTDGYVAMVDDEDYKSLIGYRWRAEKHRRSVTVYAVRKFKRGGKTRTISMHTQITGYEQTDHKDRNGLNNQRSNCRIVACSYSEGIQKMTPRNTFDRDPNGTYRKMHASIDKDVKNGYIDPQLERKLRSAANRLYLRGKKVKGNA